jgi:hypothetical protein
MDQTLAEKAEFRHMISNINNLFAGMKVLILLDLTYMSRFCKSRSHPLDFDLATDEHTRTRSRTNVPLPSAIRSCTACRRV